MPKHVEPDSDFARRPQDRVDSDKPTILPSVSSDAPADADGFAKASRDDAEPIGRQPRALSAQLRRGIGDRRVRFGAAVFDDTAAFADTTLQQRPGPLGAGRPDSAAAHPHLFRRVAIAGIRVGDE